VTSTSPVPVVGAKVVDVIDPIRLVINRGAQQGVRIGQRFIVFGLGPEVTDPETNLSLGRIEIVRGTAKVSHVQELMATLTSDHVTPRRVKSSQSLFGLGAQEDTIMEKEPFDEPERGDHARPI
jgi:hypothetical protein